MTVEEKILSMEMLWQDLCSHSNFESPDCHEFILTSRQEKRTSGNQQPMDWSDAKRQILNAIK